MIIVVADEYEPCLVRHATHSGETIICSGQRLVVMALLRGYVAHVRWRRRWSALQIVVLAAIIFALIFGAVHDQGSGLLPDA